MRLLTIALTRGRIIAAGAESEPTAGYAGGGEGRRLDDAGVSVALDARSIGSA